MLLYIHVPFCRARCAYCDFYSLPLAPRGGGGEEIENSGPVGDWLAALLVEMRFWRERLGPRRIGSVFFGGGTPSLLPPAAVGRVLDLAAALFALAPDAEISIEANPESAARPGWAHGVRAAGANRLSIGAQSFSNADLRRLGRRHRAADILAAFDAARAAGFWNIGLDLMWALPGAPGGRPQPLRAWLRQLERALTLAPEHISAYALTLEPRTPLALELAAGTLRLPGERAQAAMYLAGAELLESRGFGHYEISNFARPGFACRHNLGYWEGRDYLGLGPAAVSTLGRRRYANPPDLARWLEQTRQGRHGDCEPLDRQTRLKETLMLRLRAAEGLALDAWKKTSGRDFSRQFAAVLPALREAGLADVRSGRFALTRRGMLVCDAVLARLFAGLEERP